MKVFVYWNIRRNLWSIRCEEKGPHKGLVVAHRANVHMTDVTPRVSEAGRQRVLRNRQKNVHAGLLGTWDDQAPVGDHKGMAITYNPYKYTGFVYTDDVRFLYQGSGVADLRGRAVLVNNH